MKSKTKLIISILLLFMIISCSQKSIIKQNNNDDLIDMSNQRDFTFFTYNDTTRILIQNQKDIERYMIRDTIWKNKVSVILYNMDDFFKVTDFINEFPNLEEINIRRYCTEIDISHSPKHLKTISIWDEVNVCRTKKDSTINYTNVIKNIEQLEFVEDIIYYWDGKNISYFDIFQKLKNLKHITLVFGSLSSKTLDKDIYLLTNLESLELVWSSFKKIPKEICQFKKLKSLTIESTNFMTAPDCLFEMDSLKTLTIKGRRSDVNKFYKKYKDKNPNIKINSIVSKYYLSWE